VAPKSINSSVIANHKESKLTIENCRKELNFFYQKEKKPILKKS
jgi:hypothetical protein